MIGYETVILYLKLQWHHILHACPSLLLWPCLSSVECNRIGASRTGKNQMIFYQSASSLVLLLCLIWLFLLKMRTLVKRCFKRRCYRSRCVSFWIYTNQRVWSDQAISSFRQSIACNQYSGSSRNRPLPSCSLQVVSSLWAHCSSI